VSSAILNNKNGVISRPLMFFDLLNQHKTHYFPRWDDQHFTITSHHDHITSRSHHITITSHHITSRLHHDYITSHHITITSHHDHITSRSHHITSHHDYITSRSHHITITSHHITSRLHHIIPCFTMIRNCPEVRNFWCRKENKNGNFLLSDRKKENSNFVQKQIKAFVAKKEKRNMVI